jgi:S-adenosylmethionine:tRNA ribosyltransferase-isomerase
VDISSLDYAYPAEAIATRPQEPCRILLFDPSSTPREISRAELFAQFKPDDVLILNDTQVSRRRVFSSNDETEILFVKKLSDLRWEVLFPARKLDPGDVLPLPGDVQMKLVTKGAPQIVETSVSVDEEYFEKWGEVALPPYIQKARNQRHASAEDQRWYQTSWAQKLGSSAAPTASLHFRLEELEPLKAQGVHLHFLTLHVGLGTFLPIRSERLDDHTMHEEFVSIPASTVSALETARQKGARIWALGTTVTRALESLANGDLAPTESGDFSGLAKLFIQPGYEWKLVSGLLTNFHQPRSTLLALVAAFAGLEPTLAAYRFAIERRFRLFSYGDLSVWLRN